MNIGPSEHDPPTNRNWRHGPALALAVLLVMSVAAGGITTLELFEVSDLERTDEPLLNVEFNVQSGA